jgi:RNA polymerase sigma-70 factor (ECF subfamily)
MTTRARKHAKHAAQIAQLAADVREERPPEPVSFSEIFSLVERQLLTLAGRRTDDFDDLLQNAGEQVLRALPTFEARAKLSTYTFRIVHLTWLKHLRSKKRWSKRFETTESETIALVAADRSSTARSPESLARFEQLRRIRAALPTLSEKRRVVVLLHDIEGLSVDEVGEVTGLSVLTVRSRLRDGRRDLAKLLSTDPYFLTS